MVNLRLQESDSSTYFLSDFKGPQYQQLIWHRAGEELVNLNEANHVEGHLAELDAKIYRTYCEHQRERFRYLEVPWWQMQLMWVNDSGVGDAEDSITCQRIDVETQVTYIDTAVAWRFREVRDWISAAHLLSLVEEPASSSLLVSMSLDWWKIHRKTP